MRRLKVDDHNVPKMKELLQFCKEADAYMKEDSDNVIAIHCKGGTYASKDRVAVDQIRRYF